jgi:3D (Asp-Asp-Asp) domain-containing protein
MSMAKRTFVAMLGCAVLLGSCTSAADISPPISTGITIKVVATAYCDRGRTASGVRAQSGIVAADPRVLPLGTVLTIVDPERLYAGTYTVMDTGRLVKGREIDIFMPSCASASRFGRKPVGVRVIRLGWNPRASADVVR